MASHFSLIINEFLQSEPLMPEVPFRPYARNEAFKDKVEKTYRLLLRAASLKQRQRTLIYAFYLGELIENFAASKQQRSLTKQWVSSYYFSTSVRTFHIFELDKSQIYRTTQLALKNIYRLNKEEYATLCPEDVLPGGSN